MLEQLNELDTRLFFLINGLHNSFFDFIMFWASNRLIWLPLYAYLLAIVVKDYKREAIMTCIVVAVMITVSDQIASAVFKNWIMRLRPCHEPALAGQVHIVNNHCGGMYGFISSHAANAFSLFTFFAIYFGRQQRAVKYILLCWAVLQIYSRVYLGVHYPGDVLAGALLGIILGYFFATVLKTFIRPTLNESSEHE